MQVPEMAFERYTVTSAYPGPTLLQKTSPEEGGKLSPMRSRGGEPKNVVVRSCVKGF